MIVCVQRNGMVNYICNVDSHSYSIYTSIVTFNTCNYCNHDLLLQVSRLSCVYYI